MTIVDDDPIYFAGDCTCEHIPEVHGYGSCGFEDCECEAGWEE